jgi:hypothetical protein
LTPGTAHAEVLSYYKAGIGGNTRPLSSIPKKEEEALEALTGFSWGRD